MEYRRHCGYGYKYGIALWYCPSDGRIVEWHEYKRLGTEKKQFVKVERFYGNSHLYIAFCPTHQRWERQAVRYSPFHIMALKKAKDCAEFKSIERLWSYSQKLAWSYVQGYKREEILAFIRRWVKRQRNFKVIDGLLALVPQLFTDLKSDEIKQIREECLLREITKNIKG
ncbi:MAG: hypothetical protein ACP5KV_04190 [Candidatus Methanomethylicaceae archaeon]